MAEPWNLGSCGTMALQGARLNSLGLRILLTQCRLAGGVDFHGFEESGHFEDFAHGRSEGREGTGAASGFHPLHRREEYPQAGAAGEG